MNGNGKLECIPWKRSLNGFSLVELLIAVGLMTIVGLAMSTMILDLFHIASKKLS